MESLRIVTGEMSLEVERDGEIVGIFKFNPRDVGQAKRLFECMGQIGEADQKFIERDQQATTPLEKSTILHEYCEYQKDRLDYIFGKGSSNILFGESESKQMFDSFYDGIVPYYAKASKDAMKKYE